MTRPFKPFKYDFAFEAFKLQNKMHWQPNEVSLSSDLVRFNNLDERDKHIITSIFKFFTQSDLEVLDMYNSNNYKELFGDYPELSMMFASFANMEAIHTHAYSYLLESFNYPTTMYSDFLKCSETYNKFLLMQRNKGDEAENAIFFALFTEGVSLFGMFIVLLNYQRSNKLHNAPQLIVWSIRDETLHVQSMTKLIASKLLETISSNNDVEMKDFIRNFPYFLQVIEHQFLPLEYNFIDLIFQKGDLENLTCQEVKNYLKWLFDYRVKCLLDEIHKGLKVIKPDVYNYSSEVWSYYLNLGECPLPWVLNYIGSEVTNFFDNTPTQYQIVEDIDLNGVNWG